MRINEYKRVCNCGRCGKDPVLFRLELIAEEPKDVAALEGLLARIKEEKEEERPLITNRQERQAFNRGLALIARTEDNFSAPLCAHCGHGKEQHERYGCIHESEDGECPCKKTGNGKSNQRSPRRVPAAKGKR